VSSSIIIVTGYDERPGFYSRYWFVFYFCAITARRALRPTRPPNHWLPRVLCLRYGCYSVKLTVASSTEVKNLWEKHVHKSICYHVVIITKEFTFVHIKKGSNKTVTCRKNFGTQQKMIYIMSFSLFPFPPFLFVLISSATFPI
jgi:hypothetical protein